MDNEREDEDVAGKEQVESDEIEGHRFRYGTEDAPGRQEESDDEKSDDEVEAHRWRYGPEEFGKRF